MKNGFNVAIVTDRGTPVISDPGYKTVQFIKENGYDSNILRVNQAQLTGFIMDKNIYRSILGYSLINMASNSNKKIIEDEAKFKEHLKVMPIVMVDYVTSTKGDFNNLVNTYIMEYNNTL